MADFILTEQQGPVALLTLNRPEVMNAWHAPMREALVERLQSLAQDDSVKAVVLTGSGERAFSAGQDLNETKTFDPDRAELWIGEWRRLYDTILSLPKPLIAALNGVAAGSAFQVALLCDLRIGHAGVRMGQPEIDSGIASTLGPWIIREHLGLAKSIELTLTGALLEGEECARLGIINRLVPEQDVLNEALKLARELAAKPPVAMRLDKQRFREMILAGFEDSLAAGVRIQREAYGSGEPAKMMEAFLAKKKSQENS